MAIDFQCPSCHKAYQVKDEFAGRTAKCTSCGEAMEVPHVAAPPEEDDDDEYRLAPLEDDPPQVSAAPMDYTVDDEPLATDGIEVDEDDDALVTDGIEVDEDEAEPSVAADDTRRCPSCQAELSPEAVLCVGCGYDLRSGKKLPGMGTADPNDPMAAANAALDAEDEKPSFLGDIDPKTFARGTAYSVAGASVGGLVWCGFMYLTGWDITPMPLAIGFLAGAGMAVGHEDSDGQAAGFVSGLVALIAILVTQVALFHISISIIFDEEETDRDTVIEQLYEEKLVEKNLTDDEIDKDTYTRIYSEAEEAVSAMSDKEIERKARDIERRGTLRDIIVQEKLEAAGKSEDDIDETTYEEIWTEAQNELSAMSDEQIREKLANTNSEEGIEAVADDEKLPLIPPMTLLFFMRFGISGSIFALLALGTAYQIGSGRMTD